MLNDYGVYALVGSTTSKISDALDGIFPTIDFTSPVYGGQVLLNGILCAAFNFKQNYYGGSRYVQAVFFEKKWFITSEGNTLQYVTSVPVSGLITLYGIDSNALYTLYSNTTANTSSTVQTALMPMGDPIRTKQALKAAIEATLLNPGTLYLTVDSEAGSSPQYVLNNSSIWTNIFGTTIGWINNSSILINWINGGYSLYKTDAQQYGKYLGQTVTATVPGITYHGYEFEHELRVRF